MSGGASDSRRGWVVDGRLTYAQPVFDKIARHATGNIAGLRMEPSGSGNPLESMLLWRPVIFGRSRRRRLKVPVQVARGWRIPELCQRAQISIADEVRRLTHYESVSVNVRVAGTFDPGDDMES